MPTILHINTTAGADTTVGRFANNLRDAAISAGWKAFVAAGFGRADIVMHTRIMHTVGALRHRITASDGQCFSRATKNLVRRIEALKPDIVHLHNLHGYYLNTHFLASYLQKAQIPTVMTVHDCRLASGRCAVCLCEKWLSRDCLQCPHPELYPAVWNFFASRVPEYRMARDLAQLNLHLVSPSWSLKNILSRSELSHIPISVIPNGIDTDIFNSIGHKKPEKTQLLAVANTWHKTKNFDALIRLAQCMPSEWQLTIIGNVTGKQRKDASRFHNILLVTKSVHPAELAKFYQNSSVTLSPSLSESFGLTLSESVACGTPVLANSEAFPQAYIPDSGGMYAPFSQPETIIRSIKRVADKPIMAAPSSLKEMAAAYLALYRQILGGEVNN